MSVGEEAEVNANKEIPTRVFHATSSKEDIDFVCALGFCVNNNNNHDNKNNTRNNNNSTNNNSHDNSDNSTENSNTQHTQQYNL